VLFFAGAEGGGGGVAGLKWVESDSLNGLGRNRHVSMAGAGGGGVGAAGVVELK